MEPKVGNDESWSWSGRVTGSGTTFVKVGSGKMTVRGVWNNTGSVRINEGELCIFSGSMLGSGSLVVAEGASLTGVTASSGFLTNAGFTINGTVQVGVTRMSYTPFYEALLRSTLPRRTSSVYLLGKRMLH